MNYNNRAISKKYKRTVQLKRRITLFVLTLLLVLATALGLFKTDAKAADKNEITLYKYYKCIEISKGDSLWDFAEKYAPDDNVDKYISEVRHINNLTSDDIKVGYNLIVPYYSTEFLN